MAIIIGRKSDTNQLKVCVEGRPEKACGTAGSVPNSVSRNHFSLEPDSNGGFLLTNLNPQNETLVNGVSVDTTHVKEGDRVELGASRYVFNWDFLHIGGVPATVDIRPLESVWEKYQSDRMQLQIKQGRFNAIGRLTGVISMVGMVLAVMDGNSSGGGSLRLILLAIGIVATVAVSAVTFINASKVPQKLADLEKDFQNNYVCPNPRCHCFMGSQSYKILVQRTSCPYCKATYIK